MRWRLRSSSSKGIKHLVTLETKEPVAFFSYPDQPSLLKEPGTLVHSLVEADEDSELALEMLLDVLGASEIAPTVPGAHGDGGTEWRSWGR